MEVAKLSALPNLKVRFVSCNESAIKRWLSSELEETVFSLTLELFMTKHHTVTLIGNLWPGFCQRAREDKGTVSDVFFFVCFLCTFLLFSYLLVVFIIFICTTLKYIINAFFFKFFIIL